MRYLSLFALSPKRRLDTLTAAVVIFALGFAAGALLRSLQLPAWPPLPTARTVVVAGVATPERAPPATAGTSALGFGAYPAEVLRVIDGDTFEARVRVWPGLDVETKVRLRNIDAPELHGRCADELARAQAARAALQAMLAAGGVTISSVGIDKYGGRIDALVATRDTPDVSAALFNGGFARSYDGGRRGSWC
jgi:endonuclease YncB( thermonuclease family)